MIDPAAQTILDAMHSTAHPMPDDTDTWLAGYRAKLEALRQWQGPPPPADIHHGPGRRVYRPRGAGPFATLLFCHGGGFVGGTLHSYDIPLRWLVLQSGWQVVAVEYRLAPEHPYPAALDDCSNALFDLTRGDHDADPERLAVMGDSAGGLLAAVLARHARDAGIALVQQILLYPNTDLRPHAPYVSRAEWDGTVVQLAELYRSLDLYLGTTDRTTPDVSPIFADLTGLCPALLITNECDPLRDEAEAYAEQLRRAGVATLHERLPGMIHGVLQYAGTVPAGEGLITRVAQALGAAG